MLLVCHFFISECTIWSWLFERNRCTKCYLIYYNIHNGNANDNLGKFCFQTIFTVWNFRASRTGIPKQESIGRMVSLRIRRKLRKIFPAIRMFLGMVSLGIGFHMLMAPWPPSTSSYISRTMKEAIFSACCLPTCSQGYLRHPYFKDSLCKMLPFYEIGTIWQRPRQWLADIRTNQSWRNLVLVVLGDHAS